MRLGCVRISSKLLSLGVSGRRPALDSVSQPPKISATDTDGQALCARRHPGAVGPEDEAGPKTSGGYNTYKNPVL